MTSRNISEKILHTIKKNHLKPKGRWQFYLKNIFIWSLASVSLFFSAASFAVLIFLLKNIDLSLSGEMRIHPLENLVRSLPYFWILFLFLFIFIIYYQVRQTKKGYLYPLWLIIISSVLSSIIIGSSFSLFGWGEKFDEVISYRAPFYSEIINPQLDFWSQPENGRLAGLVISEGDYVYLIDKDGNKWIVEFRRDTHLPPFLFTSPVKVLGEKLSENKFIIYKVTPLMPGKGMFRKPGMGHSPINMHNISPEMMPLRR